MSAFRHFPTGTRIPDNPHAVIVSLPTFADVVGYEERRPETMDAVRTGYPRFLQHPYVTAVARHLFLASKLPTRALFPVASAEVARRVAALAGAQDWGVVESDGWALLHTSPTDPATAARAGKIIQHTGVAVSSRQAEDWLLARGLPLPALTPIAPFERAATAVVPAATPSAAANADVAAANAERIAAEIVTVLAPLLAPAGAADVLLCRSGMNAFYAAFEAIRALQLPRGRTRWLHLGWLYTDTTEILRKCLGTDESFDFLPDVLDKAAVEKFFADNAGKVAAVVTETPTNPLVRTPDMAWLSALARQHGAVCVADPSISGLVNVNLVPFADVLVTSLTKYAGNGGDVMAGALVVNPAAPDAAALLSAARLARSPAYWRDLARLAEEMTEMTTVAARINENTGRLSAWLGKHPAVRRVLRADDGGASAANYAAIARGAGRPGCMLTIELNIPPARFYDRIRCAKGPSFGTGFTIVSPYIYMAHYELVGDAAQRRYLLDCGIDPELIRVSVGAEDYTEIEAVFAEALA
ncbi:MAG: PLP-dependent transferase [Puniceicoccales bacterium]|jgi:cystathionine gamma-synthase|nr:PLP-dependent transferase [Puniceicoccales bacterium]